MKVSIPFRDDMAQEAIDGRKTCTSRNKKCGEPGDDFEIGEHLFILTSVTRQYLNTIASSRFKEEGFDSPEAFMDAWAELHPRNGWEPHKQVWLHEFEEEL